MSREIWDCPVCGTVNDLDVDDYELAMDVDAVGEVQWKEECAGCESKVELNFEIEVTYSMDVGCYVLADRGSNVKEAEALEAAWAEEDGVQAAVLLRKLGIEQKQFV